VEPGLRFESCSSEVGDALGADVMKSVRYLLPDLLAAYPLLLYQGECAVSESGVLTGWLVQGCWVLGFRGAGGWRMLQRAELAGGQEPRWGGSHCCGGEWFGVVSNL
jgi:hypothetical protein